jgi:hypothetical protein
VDRFDVGPCHTLASRHRAGFLYFFRTKGGSMDVEWDDPEGWDSKARAYYDAEPWFAPAR